MTKVNKEQLEELQAILNEAIAKRFELVDEEAEENEETEVDEEVEQETLDAEDFAEDSVEDEVDEDEDDEDDEEDEDSEAQACCKKSDDDTNETLENLLNSDSFKELAKACKEEHKRSSFDKVADSVRDGADCFGELGEYIDEKFGVRIPMDPMPKPPFPPVPPVPPTTPPVDFKTIGKVVGGTLGFGFGLLEVLSDKLSEM